MNYWFTSDFHFGHKNIIEYCNRPFKNVEEMNKVMIDNFNKVVKEEDTVYILGDVAFYNSKACEYKGEGLNKKPEEYLDQLNGNHITVNGNHDRNNKIKTKHHRIVLYISKMFVNLVHDPEHGNLDYPLNLVGHVHNQWKVKVMKKENKESLMINVGVDQWKFRPISWQKIQKVFDQYKAGQDVEAIYNG